MNKTKCQEIFQSKVAEPLRKWHRKKKDLDAAFDDIDAQNCRKICKGVKALRSNKYYEPVYLDSFVDKSSSEPSRLQVWLLLRGGHPDVSDF